MSANDNNTAKHKQADLLTHKKEKSKERILHSATKIFAQKGFDGTGIREICKDANVNICMISYYWGGKKELYYDIIDDLVKKQIAVANKYFDLNKDLTTLTKSEQITLLYAVLDKMIDFFYSNVSADIITILLKEQQNKSFKPSSPVLDFVIKLLALIFEKDERDKDLIYKFVFIISQINSPRILPAFSLNKLNQKDFMEDDILIIKNNVKLYIQALLKESKL